MMWNKTDLTSLHVILRHSPGVNDETHEVSQSG